MSLPIPPPCACQWRRRSGAHSSDNPGYPGRIRAPGRRTNRALQLPRRAGEGCGDAGLVDGVEHVSTVVPVVTAVPTVTSPLVAGAVDTLVAPTSPLAPLAPVVSPLISNGTTNLDGTATNGGLLIGNGGTATSGNTTLHTGSGDATGGTGGGGTGGTGSSSGSSGADG